MPDQSARSDWSQLRVHCVNCITSNLFKTCLKASFWPDFQQVCTDFLLSKVGLFRSCVCVWCEACELW